MANAYKQLRDKVRSDPARAARVDAHRQAMSQANVSRIERQRDLYLSTLAQCVTALGGTLKVSAVFDDEEVEIIVATGTVRRRR